MEATMHDVARVAQVSVKTVSNVINHHPHVRQSTKDRVLAAIEQLDYRPNLSARGLRSGRSGFISLVIPAVKENYFAELAEVVIREAESLGLSVVVEQTTGDRRAERNALSGAGRPRFFDGIILSPMSLQPEDMETLDANVPVVLLGERIFGGPTDHVAIQNVAAAKAATEHLLSIGRRRIALIGAGPDDQGKISSAGLRLQGYTEALVEAGVAVDPDLLRYSKGWNRAAGTASLQKMMGEGIDFDAVFALNDSQALGALRALASAGLSVPDDVALMGFDNIDETAYSVPSISTVDAGRGSIAAAAVKMLNDRITGNLSDPAPRTETAAFRVIARESTGFSEGEMRQHSTFKRGRSQQEHLRCHAE